MAIGDPADILARIKAVTPRRWWGLTSPIRDALVAGVAVGATWCYSWITYARLQTRLTTATGFWLDLISFDFLGRFLPRNGLSDTTYRKLILATILQERVTRKGMTQILTALLGAAPTIIEPWNTGDTGGWGIGTLAYGRSGYWGSMNLPGQVFMRLSRVGLGASGIPGVVGYQNQQVGPVSGYGGYGAGNIQYVGVEISEIGVTDEVIENAIKYTKPTGVIAWIKFA